MNEKLKPLIRIIVALVLSGLSIRCINRVLREKYKVRIKEHALRQYILESRVVWANSVLTSSEDKQNLAIALKRKVDQRKSTARSRIPANCHADVIAITNSSINVKASLDKVNKFLDTQSIMPVNYPTLCRFLRKMKGGVLISRFLQYSGRELMFNTARCIRVVKFRQS